MLTDYLTDEELETTVPKKYERLGWKPAVVDICWMACTRPGFQRRLTDREIILCARHIREFENDVSESGSSWPWQKVMPK